MTNTPMTFDEWFASTRFSTLKNNVQKMCAFNCGDEAWQASQAQQAQTIAELKREIAAKDSLIDSYREMEADCTKQAQTISELVECLEEILIDTNEGQIMHIASEAIAKVKGK